MAAQQRMRVEDRKLLILQAAMDEYARTGLHGTSTETIAERAGVSQPYLFRLFGTKKGLIVAAIRHHTERLRAEFAAAVASRAEGVTPLDAIADAYLQLLLDDPNALRCQLHTWAEGSDPEIGPVARETYLQIIDDAERLSGEPRATVLEFMAQGMLMTVAASLDLTALLFADPHSTTPPTEA